MTRINIQIINIWEWQVEGPIPQKGNYFISIPFLNLCLPSVISLLFSVAVLNQEKMAGSQCCAHPPTLNPSSGAGHVEKVGGLDSYVSGSPDSKLAILLVSDVYGKLSFPPKKILFKAALRLFLFSFFVFVVVLGFVFHCLDYCDLILHLWLDLQDMKRRTWGMVDHPFLFYFWCVITLLFLVPRKHNLFEMLNICFANSFVCQSCDSKLNMMLVKLLKLQWIYWRRKNIK